MGHFQRQCQQFCAISDNLAELSVTLNHFGFHWPFSVISINLRVHIFEPCSCSLPSCTLPWDQDFTSSYNRPESLLLASTYPSFAPSSLRYVPHQQTSLPNTALFSDRMESSPANKRGEENWMTTVVMMTDRRKCREDSMAERLSDRK